ncbi:MAG: hypothetical protein ACFFCY_05015 [Promethearchaeota archaeon]
MISPFIKNFHGYSKYEKILYKENPSYTPISSTRDNNELLDSIFNFKVLDYYQKGYFPQIYEPSLQASYYALYTLQSVGKLHEINCTDIINYIMKHYDVSSNSFKDTLAYRYLDTDFTKSYFPLNSILEVTCYAILSLELLGALDLIDISEMINFIWSCYNPSSGGFIGQPYNVGLEAGFKVATADNTYFAVITLDLLMEDWLGYSSQKTNIISFINRLQVPDGSGWASGGFKNDEAVDFNFLLFYTEPNLISSYYCIKTLEIFGMIYTINEVSFHQFLNFLHDSDYHYFRISEIDYGVNYTNIVATSLGLELANITNFSGINRTETISFILDNRNTLGNWDQSTTITIHELIDTYQIIRSLNNTKDISHLSFEDRNQIGNATLYYRSYQGFSLLSDDYTSMNLIYTIIGSFNLYNRISELNIQQLYTMIKNSYKNYPAEGLSRTFNGYIINDMIIYWFRSCPIEYYTSGHKNYIHRINQINSHQSTYYGLEALSNIFKLDDFAFTFDLMDLLNDIVDTQFLNDSYYDTFGAFSSFVKYNEKESEYINNRIYCDYTYYAIKCLELITNYLNVNLDDTGIDTTAIYTYIDRNIIESPSTLYFNPKYTDDIETILKTTYYMVYVLYTLNLYNKNSQKIKNYVETNLNYSNIMNIYYSYKLSELLNLNIDFDFHKIHSLVQDIYSEEFKEFYYIPDKTQMHQEIFLWICKMARKSQIGIEARYSESCPLGTVNPMSVSLYNLILRDFGTYITFKFESEQIGSYVFSKLSNDSFVYDIPIPVSSIAYPKVEGYFRAYEGTQIKAEYFVSFSTNYILDHNVKCHYDLSSFTLEINASIMAGDAGYPTTSGSVYARIYRNGDYIQEAQAIREDLGGYSTFHIIYHPQITGEYRFDVYLNDGISGSIILIKTISCNINEILKGFEEEVASAIPLSIIFIVVPGIVIAFSTKKLNNSKKESKKF